MRETMVRKVMRADREMRTARTSYVIASIFFGLFGFIRLLFLAVEFDIYSFLVGVSMLGIFVLCIRANLRIKASQIELQTDPKKFLNSPGPAPLSISTFFPFTRNGS
jgi:hypothetical protein